MVDRLIFCEECRKDVAYNVIEVQMEAKLKEEEYLYKGKKAVCNECGAEVYIPEVDDINLKLLYDAYRVKHDLISLEAILEIPKRYGIGKRPLSLLLGWGEMTYSRYCDGYLPTKQYSKILKRVYDDPEYYYNLLEDNKDNLKSSMAYEKSKRAVDELLGRHKLKLSKIDIVIDYLLCRCEDITPLALQKALYYIQGFFYAFNEDYLFDEDCEAWAHGPVYRDIYYRYKLYRFDPIEGGGICNDEDLVNYEKAIIDSVIKNLCCYSGKILERFTHTETPWLKTRGDLHSTESSDRIIDKKDISEYFCLVKENYSMMNPADIEKYSNRMFEQVR